MSDNKITRLNNNWTNQSTKTTSRTASITRTPIVLLNNFMPKNSTTFTAEPDTESTPVTKINNYIRAPTDEDDDDASPAYRSDPVRPFTAPIQWTSPNTNLPIIHHMRRRCVIGTHRV